MQRYIIKELFYFSSHRQGTEITCKSLTSAKRWATKNRCFADTVLKIESTDTRICLSTNIDGKWVDIQ